MLCISIFYDGPRLWIPRAPAASLYHSKGLNMDLEGFMAIRKQVSDEFVMNLL